MFPSKWRHTGWCCCCTLSHQTDHAFVITWHIQSKAWPTAILTGGHLKGDNLPPVIAQWLAGTPILTGWKWIYQSQFWFYLHVRAAPAQPSQSSSRPCHQRWNKLPPKVRKAESLPIFPKTSETLPLWRLSQKTLTAPRYRCTKIRPQNMLTFYHYQ
jgi:hypothetical protein